MPKTITTVTDSLYEYMRNTWLRESDVLKELREETALMKTSSMQISPDQGQFMAFLVRLMNAKRIVEVGTFTGYSALAMALATAEDAKIICCDVSVEWTNIGKNYWQRAGVVNKIDLRIAPALDTLGDLMVDSKNEFDFAFIDADKTNYDAYYEACYALIKPNGVIAIDNVFWGGSVADTSQQDDDTKAIRALNKKLQNDNRVDLSIVPIGDGLTLARKLG
jgi:predicted O-methyltransferase YrrM